VNDQRMQSFILAQPITLLPIQPSQRVVILSGTAPCGQVVVIPDVTPIVVAPANPYDTERSARPALPRQGALPLSSGSVHHVVAPSITRAQAGWLLAEAARVLAPGGWLLVYARNDHWMQWLAHRSVRLRRNRAPRPELPLGMCTQLLRQNHLTVFNLYGIDGELEHMNHLIPLDQPGAVRFYFHRLIVPNSHASRFARRCAALFTAIRLHSALFRSIAVVAQRPPAHGGP